MTIHHLNHWLIDLQGATHLQQSQYALDTLLTMAKRCQTHVVSHHVQSFGNGAGVSVMVILAESHISLHSWPEHGSAVVDALMCGHVNPHRGLAVLQQAFHPQWMTVQTTQRWVHS